MRTMAKVIEAAKVRLMLLSWKRENWRDAMAIWIANRLPRKVAYFAVVRVAVRDVGGATYQFNPGERRVFEIMKTWEAEAHGDNRTSPAVG